MHKPTLPQAGALLFASALFLASCTTTDNAKKLVGQWRAASWTSGGTVVTQHPEDVSFQFKDDGNYTYTNTGQTESGLYKLDGDNLYTTPTGQQEIMVKIVTLGADSLVFDMNRAGTAERLTLLRQK